MGSESRPNVLLVVLDSVRAMNCSLHGAPRATTPFLDRFATEARTYTQARAPSNWSLPSHVSLLTGLETHEHGVTVHDALRPGNTVFDDLAAAGYATGVFSENGFLTGDAFGLSAAFRTVVDVPDVSPDRYDTAEINTNAEGPAVHKRYYWGEEGADSLIRRAGHIEATTPVDQVAVNAAFTDSTATVREPREGQAITDRTKDQLAALGYY